jgi:hypothetical protein
LVQECGADANTANHNGTTPVCIAAYNGHTETVRALVQEFGANPNTATNDGTTPVYLAAEEGLTETVRTLVQERGANPNTANNCGTTPVYIAAYNGLTETVRTLVQECGANPNTANDNGTTPVYIAAERGFTETVRALVQDCGADVNAHKNGNTPVCIAAWMGHTETVRALLREGRADPFQALLATVQHDDAEVTWRLVRECGVNPDCRNRDGKRARDLAPPGSRPSRAYRLLECLEGLQAPGHTLYTAANAEKRAEGFECPVCLEETKGDSIAFVPCGHRVCPGCWANMRARDMNKCPKCRAPILHCAPQESLPDQQRLYSRFCVEVPQHVRVRTNPERI